MLSRRTKSSCRGVSVLFQHAYFRLGPIRDLVADITTSDRIPTSAWESWRLLLGARGFTAVPCISSQIPMSDFDLRLPGVDAAETSIRFAAWGAYPRPHRQPKVGSIPLCSPDAA
ncbi:hypothetical protein CDEST_13502 [Colletotrichum destructivum]|uniref:Uncharacterized protein n=1 Tax=Colletotrichum destructivum TaxID=34406 RepID=A0AAX4IZD0_9PEZI|nr:hypothetical protein CDEST_13502 [Colletotrichum destructivum]